MSTEARVVLCTVPTKDNGVEISRELVQRRLAACVNIVPGITSIFRWKGEIKSDTELLMIIKTHSNVLEPLLQLIQELHPYELPEIIAVSVTGGLPAYLSWIEENTGT